MLDFGDIHVFLIKIIINFKVEIISDNFWKTFTSEVPEGCLVKHINYLPNLKGISVPFLRKNTGTQEMTSHKSISINC